MTPLGKPLVFYLKYLAEMDRLYGTPEYGGEEPDLTELANAEQVREMARMVGAAAFEQAADFLELCGKEIEKHFTGIRNVTHVKKSKRSYVVRNWVWEATIQVSSIPGALFQCVLKLSAPPQIPVSLEKNVCGAVIPWFWSTGGRKAEDAVWKILGGQAHSRAGEGYVTHSGTVALACIPIKTQPPDSFDVDREQLLAEVMTPFARIGAKQTKAIASFVGSLKESNEG